MTFLLTFFFGLCTISIAFTGFDGDWAPWRNLRFSAISVRANPIFIDCDSFLSSFLIFVGHFTSRSKKSSTMRKLIAP